jgi:hypothetical protein
MTHPSKKIIVAAYGGQESEPSTVGHSLARELALVRPAVLYSDRVVLMSAAYQLNRSIEAALGEMGENPEPLVRILTDVLPHLAARGVEPSSMQDFVHARQMLDGASTPEERNAARERMRMLTRGILEVLHTPQGQTIVNKMLDWAGMAELRSAWQQGILEIEQLPEVDAGPAASALAEFRASLLLATITASPDIRPRELPKLYIALTRRLVAAICHHNSYPMLDEDARRVLGAQQEVAQNELARRRSKVGGVANHVLGRLPVAQASLQELCEIRQDLCGTLGAFHVAISELAMKVEPAQWEPGFEDYVDFEYCQFVAPVVREISARLAEIQAKGRKPGPRTNIVIGIRSTQPLIRDWMANILTLSASLPPAVLTLIENLVSEISRETDAELGKLAENKLFYWSAVEQRLRP